MQQLLALLANKYLTCAFSCLSARFSTHFLLSAADGVLSPNLPLDLISAWQDAVIR